MPSSARDGSLPFNEQITFFRNKLNVPTESWTELWRHGHNSGFSVAGAMKDDLLNDFRRAVDAAIADGKSLTWFKKEFNNIVAKHGWQHTGKAGWRAKVIFDTNMRQSYNAGRYEQLQQFDYWRYAHGDSRYPRELHLKWHDTLLPKSDVWWQTHFPQNGWGCKCRIYGVSQSELERKGLTTAAAPNDGLRDWTDKTTGEVHQIPKGIDPGFDYIPKRSANQTKQQQLAKQKAPVYQVPERLVPTAFSTVKGVNVDGLNQVLSAISKNSSAPQVARLGEFLKIHDIRSVFVKQAEMGLYNKGAKDIEQAVLGYLKPSEYNPRYLYAIRGYKNTRGFTSKHFDHVVVKVASTTTLSKVDVNELRQLVALAHEFYKRGKPEFSMSHIVRTYGESKGHSGTIVTWLHELGHQVHYKAGGPSAPAFQGLTRYGGTNSAEWHAEHFAAWLLNRNALAEFNADIANYFDKLVEQAIANGANNG
ncbi:F protein [Shewanella sp. GutCb]|uniref:phage minor head protein n=1 Tax=Shewanella sp. GutCb TaxID=2058315 RepID=UPI000C7C948C|nr:phage minor head protein [Shewanella sp. GutCb]PKG74228.1 F protein [Shewanella sp. GutCb]